MTTIFAGDMPDIQVLSETQSYSVARVSEETKGSPDGDTVALSLGGAISEPFSVTALTASKVRKLPFFLILIFIMFLIRRTSADSDQSVPSRNLSRSTLFAYGQYINAYHCNSSYTY